MRQGNVRIEIMYLAWQYENGIVKCLANRKFFMNWITIAGDILNMVQHVTYNVSYQYSFVN